MSVFDAVVLIAAVCGLAMVVGGIFLLARGAITLATTPKGDALSVEFRRQFKMTTQVPGIAFFLVGLIFVGIAIYFAEPPPVIPVDLQGEVSDVHGPVTVTVSSRWKLPTFTSGEIHGRIYPDITTLIVEVTESGYKSVTAPIDIRPGQHWIASIGTVRLEKKIDEIPAKPSSIQPVGFSSPPVDQPGSFGVAR